jgi:hypothetical protein|tara:strand:+ start:53 stop:457 length:405 start_codon:yes stop_codon:yes gene_type:complete
MEQITASTRTIHSGVIVSSLTFEEYKKYIHYIVNRIITEKLFAIEEKRQTTKIVFSIKLKYVEWYLELEDDVKCDVEDNLKRHLIRQIQTMKELEGVNHHIVQHNTTNDISNRTNRILGENDDHKNNKRQRVNI